MPLSSKNADPPSKRVGAKGLSLTPPSSPSKFEFDSVSSPLHQGQSSKSKGEGVIIEHRGLAECVRSYRLIKCSLDYLAKHSFLGSKCLFVVERLYDSIIDWDVDALSFIIKIGRVVRTFTPLILLPL